MEWNEPSYMATLAAAYAELGDFNEAVKWQRKALEDPSYEKEEGKKARRRLELFTSKVPYREYGVDIESILGLEPKEVSFPKSVPATFDP
jgi:hypothetical protein